MSTPSHCVYKTLDSIFSILSKSKNCALPEVKELIYIYKNKAQQSTANSNEYKALIVFEGFDGTGKSTIVKVMNERLLNKAHIYSTPPQCVKHLRETFDTKTSVLRRAFYSLGNYIAALEIKEILKEKIVIVDRFWHSTSASALSENVLDESSLPEPESDIFNWPDDLLKPDIVLFLSVPEEIRIKRLSRRKNYTAEEDRLRNDHTYRNILYTSFMRMKNPPVVKVVSIKSPMAIADMVLNLLKERKIKL